MLTVKLLVAAVLLTSCYALDLQVEEAPATRHLQSYRTEYQNCNNGVGCCKKYNDQGQKLYCFFKNPYFSQCLTYKACKSKGGEFDCGTWQGHCGKPRTYGYPDASRDGGDETGDFDLSDSSDKVFDQEAYYSGADVGVQTMQGDSTNNQRLVAEKDFESALRQRARFQPDEFSFKFPAAANPPNPAPTGGSIRQFTVDQAPFLGALPSNGMAQALITLLPCGINQPHVHPRGTEVAHVLEGEIFFGLVEENTGRFVSATLQQGQSFVFPAGLFHFVQNLGCTPVKFLASFDHRDPGTVTFASNFFRSFPDSTLQATLGLPAAEFQKVRDSAKAQVNPSQDPVCLKACQKRG